VAALAGRVAVVTGAASGIGRAIAERFAAEGAKVALADRDEPGVRAAADEVGGLAVVVDVAVPEEVDRALDEVVVALGPPDVVVNNAAIIRYSTFLELELEEFEDVMRVNAAGTFLVTQAAVRRMPEDERPRAIVNLASAEGRTVIARSGHPQIHYGASKAAIEMLTRSLAVELAPRGIRVNAVCPGLVATPFTAGVAADPEASAWFVGHTLLDRFGRPEEIAAAVLFLASDEASYVTGSTLVVDGGWLT
jgi:NAD(P)-dependent dehydrogenase (short-subunit alcohol dehydrogenase family)